MALPDLTTLKKWQNMIGAANANAHKLTPLIPKPVPWPIKRWLFLSGDCVSHDIRKVVLPQQGDEKLMVIECILDEGVRIYLNARENMLLRERTKCFSWNFESDGAKILECQTDVTSEIKMTKLVFELQVLDQEATPPSVAFDTALQIAKEI